MARKKTTNAAEGAGGEPDVESEATAAAQAATEAKEAARAFPWYEPNPEDWTTAKINLGHYGFGTFTIREPAMQTVKQADNLAGKGTANVGDDVARLNLSKLRAYVVEHDFLKDDPSCARVTVQLPKRTADIKTWETWYQALPRRICAHLLAGIDLFDRDYGVELGKN